MDTLIRIQLSSPAFENGEKIPEEFTCDGENQSPPLQIAELPVGTQSLVLIMEDPDAPAGTWTHWLMWNIPPTNEIEKGSSPGVQGKNDFGDQGYKGPCTSLGTHRYYIRVYAIDINIDLPAGSTKAALLNSMSYHILGSGELMGFYSR
ncbi:YbhB/YbcL family Raf kinase inhibitor-like protein [Pontibacter locisalis]|uniref:YbhB/YbcL family Raf kinase inhibitor-like protein n=1 Tax=Pontibacter locisalis TaxID=1719035 RepID=A0ABW5IFX7_9BACT